MTEIFVIEDSLHAEHLSEHVSLEQAWLELSRLSRIPWGEPPNLPPCGTGLACERSYEIVQYGCDEGVDSDWRLERRLAGFEISAKGVIWHGDCDPHPYDKQASPTTDTAV